MASRPRLPPSEIQTLKGNKNICLKVCSYIVSDGKPLPKISETKKRLQKMREDHS